MRTTNMRRATMGMGLVAGLAAVAACAPLDPGEPGTGTASEALNVNPARSAETALASGRNFGAQCALWDSTVNREVVISAFGYNGASATPTYLDTYDLYDDGASGSNWVVNGTTISGGGNTAATAAYVAAVTGPEVDGSGHLTTCYFAGGYNGTLQDQVWKATVSNHVVTWTKLNSMNVARAKFGLAVGGDSPNQRLIAVGGGFGTTRTNTIETFEISNPGPWNTETPTLSEAKHSFGFVKLSDTRLVTAGGDIDVGGSPDVSAHINAIKVNADGTVNSVGNILNAGATLIAARKDNIVVPTGKTNGLVGAGANRTEIQVAMGQTQAALVTAATRLVIDWTSTPAYVALSVAPGSAPSTDLAFPTIVDAYVSPKNASSNPGYMVLGGIDDANPQLADTPIEKWIPSPTGTTSGSWATPASFANSKVGVNAVYIKSIDKVLAAGGTDRYPASGSSNDRLTTDVIQ